jgi:hypothetical protein
MFLLKVSFPGGYKSVGKGIFKDPFLIGIFTLSSPHTTHITPINMFFLSIGGFLRSIDPWVVPHHEDVDSYGASILLTTIDIVDPINP